MDYKKINKEAWNLRTAAHVVSEFYNHEAFLRGENTLREIELNLLGKVEGKSILHLQCHFGQDTLSLARMGATVTGIDLSDDSIALAKQTAQDLQLKAEFICCDLYDTPETLNNSFDMVFTSYGTIGWLPDIKRWASVVARVLKPGGRFVFTEFHPVVWMYDNDFTHVQYSYFNHEPIVESNVGTYANEDAPITYQTVGWNHGLAEVLQALLDEQLQLQNMQEYNYSPYNCLSHMKEIAPNRFILEPFGDKVPLVYSLVMVKK